MAPALVRPIRECHSKGHLISEYQAARRSHQYPIALCMGHTCHEYSMLDNFLKKNPILHMASENKIHVLVKSGISTQVQSIPRSFQGSEKYFGDPCGTPG
jgi:hypothetical protein